MFGYFLRRSLISLRQSRIWSLLPLSLSIVFGVWLYFDAPRTYQVSGIYSLSAISGNQDYQYKSDKSALEAWGGLTEDLPSGMQLINSKIREISRNREVINAWTNDPLNKEKEKIARRSGSIGRYVIGDIKDSFIIEQEPGNPNKLIQLTYIGTNQQLGEQLVLFYSKALLSSWQEEIQEKLTQENTLLSRLNDLLADQFEEDDDDEDEAVEPSPMVKKKIENHQKAIASLNNKLLLISGDFNDIQTTVLKRNLSDNIVLKVLVFFIIVGFLTMVFAVGKEFFSKSFTTEFQVSQYLDVRLVGTIQKIDGV